MKKIKEGHYLEIKDIEILDHLITGESEEKSEILDRLKRGLEQEKMIKQLTGKKKILPYALFGLLTMIAAVVAVWLLIYVITEDPWMILLLLVLYLLMSLLLTMLFYTAQDISERRMKKIKIPEVGFYRKEDIQKLNCMLAETGRKLTVTVNAERGLNAYEVIYDDKRIDVSDCIPYGSPDVVPIRFTTHIALYLNPSKPEIKNMDRLSIIIEKMYEPVSVEESIDLTYENRRSIQSVSCSSEH